MKNFGCRICKSKYKSEIEKDIQNGVSFREAAKRYMKHFDCELHLLEQSMSTHTKKHLDKVYSNELTQEDIELLERFRKGEVDFDEAARIIATKAFEKILRNPGSIQVRDWLQSELIKVKRQEIEEKNNWAMELVSRMFMGSLPAKNCTVCGNPFIHEEASEGLSPYPNLG